VNALACAAFAAAVLAVGCQSIVLGPTKPDAPGAPPEQPQIEPFDEIIPQEAFGPVGPLPGRWPLAARLRLAPPNEAFSLFMSDVRIVNARKSVDGLWGRCQSVYVASTETYGKDGALMSGSGGSPTCAVGANRVPRWPGLDLSQISCDFEVQLTAGTVRADLDAVRIVFSSGVARTYRLDGPLLPHAPDRRVFLLDHGSLIWEVADGMKGDRVVVSQHGTNRYCH
jgi:hypothetical protein